MKDSAAYVVVGFVTTVLGPVLGPFALLLFGAVCGSLLALSKAPSKTRVEGIVFILIGVAVALSLTGLAVLAVERYTGFPGNLVLMPLSFAIAAGRDFILAFIQRVFEGLGDAVAAIMRARGG